jgi:dihydrofolate reductase
MWDRTLHLRCRRPRFHTSIGGSSNSTPLLLSHTAIITISSLILATIIHFVVINERRLTPFVLNHPHSSVFFLVDAFSLQRQHSFYHSSSGPRRCCCLYSPTSTTAALALASTTFLAMTTGSTQQSINVPTTKNRLVGCINIALSVDGYIADKNGSIDWLNEQQQQHENTPPSDEGGEEQQQESEEDYGFIEFLKNTDLMIMGRNTFDVVVGFGKDLWVYGDDLPILVYTRNVEAVTIPEWIPKSVTTKSATSPEALWKEILEEEEEEVVVIDGQQERRRWSDGKTATRVYIDGGRTIQAFLRAGLIHQMTLTRIPILLGEGIPLFDEKDPIRRQLKHVSTKAYPNGMVTTTYDVVDQSVGSGQV